MRTPLPFICSRQVLPTISRWRHRISVALFLLVNITTTSLAQNKIWDKSFGGDKEDEMYIFQQTRDGGYILGGYSASGISGDKSEATIGYADYWIVKLKADGTKEWDKAFRGNRDDYLGSLQQTADNGYILGGSSNSDKASDKSEGNKGPSDTNDYWVIKLDANGNKIWDKTIGGNNQDFLSSVQQTKDGGYILGGSSYSNKSGDKSEDRLGDFDDSYEYYGLDYWVVKLDATGNKVWDQTLGGESFDGLTSVLPTSDGSYIVGGSSESKISKDKSEDQAGIWLVKLNTNGGKVWDKSFGGDFWDVLSEVQPTQDGGYILGGSSASGKSGDKSEAPKGGIDYWIVKVNANGKKEWDKTLGGTSEDRLSSLQQTLDGGYILGGTSFSGIPGADKSEYTRGGEDYWIVKLTASGTRVWDKTIGGNSSDYLNCVQQTLDGNYLLGGSSFSDKTGDKSQASKGGFDYWLVKLDNSGTKLNQVLTFETISDKTFGDAPFTLQAAVDTSEPINFSIVSGPATVSGNILTITGVGTITVKAAVAGNATYKPAEITRTFKVYPAVVGVKQWDKTLGGDKPDIPVAMVPTPDGGYLLGGTSQSTISGDKSQANKGQEDYWIVKTDNKGKKIWDKTFGGTAADKLTALIPTADGNYLLGGYSSSPVSNDKSQAGKGATDFWVIKIDASGTKLWDKTYGGTGADNLATLLATNNGGYLLAGSSASGQGGDKSENNKGVPDAQGNLTTDYWVIQIDATGKKLWDKTYGGSKSDNLAAIVATSTDGYLLGGSSASDISGDKSQATRALVDYWVVQISSNGAKIWDKTFGGIKTQYETGPCGPDEVEECIGYYGQSLLASLTVTPDGGFLLGGSSNAAKGAEKSERNTPFPENYGVLMQDYWVVKIDKKGNKVWDNTYGGVGEVFAGAGAGTIYVTGDSRLATIIAAPDGNFLLAGTSNSNRGGDKNEDSRGGTQDYSSRYDYWLLLIDGNGVKKWDRTMGGFKNDFLAVAVSGPAGYYTLGGHSSSGVSGEKSESLRDESTEDEGAGKSDFWLVNLQVNTTPPTAAQWNMRYGGSGADNFTSAIRTRDGGYLSGGYTNASISGDKTQTSQGKNDYWIVKSDKNGQKIWDKRFGGSGDDYLNRVIQTTDGGYLLAGSSLSGKNGDKSEASKGNRDYWVVKTDAQGNKQWDKTYGGSGYDELKKVVQLASGEYVLGGYSNSPVSGDKTQATQGSTDYWLVKISKNGTKLWDKRYGGSAAEELGSFVETDGGLLLGGTSLSGQSGDKSQVSQGGSDYWAVQTDQRGNLLWEKAYGGNGNDVSYSVARNGTDYYLSGTSRSGKSGDKTQTSQGGSDYWVVKINRTGNKIWDKRFGGSQDDELRASSLISKNLLVVAGTSFSGISGAKTQANQGATDYWVVALDANGDQVYDKSVGGNNTEELRTVLQTKDGGLLLGGRSNSGVSGDRTQPSQGNTDYWLVKIAPVTQSVVATRTTTVVEETKATLTPSIIAYPNPFQEKVAINFTSPQTQAATVRVLDSQGREITTLFQQEAQANQTYQLEWQSGKQEAGMYLLQLQTPTGQSTRKVILRK